MRVALISPYHTGPARGNITTVRRISLTLRGEGVKTVVLPLDQLRKPEMESALASFAPDIVHAFHAGYCGEMACDLAERFGVPCVITITGSDIYEESFREGGTGEAVSRGQAVVCFDEFVAADVQSFFPGIADAVTVIPQGVMPLSVGTARFPSLRDDEFVLLLPAALRPVKNIEMPLRALRGVSREIANLRLVVAGGVIDENYAGKIRTMLERTPFATWLGEVPHGQMGDLYHRADVVMNCSRFEAMPNSLLEAMALGRPVLAPDIPGTRSLIRHEVTGFHYHDEIDFARQVVRLASDVALRRAVGARARQYVLSHFSPSLEARRYVDLYTRLLRERRQ